MISVILILLVAVWAARVQWVRLHHDPFTSEVRREQARLRRLGRAAGWRS
jgi:hypothetical protein